MLRFGLWDKDRPHIPPRHTVATIRVLQHIFVTAESWRLCLHHRCQSCLMTSEGVCVCWKLLPHYYTVQRQVCWANRAVPWETVTAVFHIESDNQIYPSDSRLVQSDPMFNQHNTNSGTRKNPSANLHPNYADYCLLLNKAKRISTGETAPPIYLVNDHTGIDGISGMVKHLVEVFMRSPWCVIPLRWVLCDIKNSSIHLANEGDFVLRWEVPLLTRRSITGH